MKRLFESVAYALLLVWVVPSFILSFYSMKQLVHTQDKQPENTEQVNSVPSDQGVVNLLYNDEIVSVSWEEYLTGVLLSEMPSSFHDEAKKAQAVIARTYALKIMKLGYKHPQGAICGNPNCCQGYFPIEKYMEKYANASDVEGARAAVKETSGLVVVYNGDLIDATYFSCSGGRTENAVAVWGTDIPYLQTVISPGEESAAVYTDTVSFTPEAFLRLLGISLPGSASAWFGPPEYTEGGGVKSIQIGGVAYAGTDLRMKLGLRSTAFTVEADDHLIRFHTKGFGHRVGMSQYGADAMGRSGYDFMRIIKHYYQGVEIVRSDSVVDD